MLRVFVFTVTAETYGSHGILKSVDKHYILADRYEEAEVHLRRNYLNAGWKILKYEANEIYIQDIRRKVEEPV